MYVVIGLTPLEEHETEQLKNAVADRMSLLAKAHGQCAKAKLHAGAREAMEEAEVCGRLLDLLDPEAHEAARVERAQLDAFSPSRNGEPVQV